MFGLRRRTRSRSANASLGRRARLWVRSLEERSVPAVVLNTNDTGAGSLRQAIEDANALGGAETITFDPTVFSTPQSIVLNGQISITDELTIQGPGQNLLRIVNGVGTPSATSRHLSINGIAGMPVSISGLTFASGNATSAGGSILVTDESVTLTNCTFTRNNVSSGGGGAVAVTTTGGSLTVNGCTFFANSTTGTTADGAAIFMGKGTTLGVVDSSMTGNSSGDNGGAVYTYGTLKVQQTTISNNVAVNGGGAFFLKGTVGQMPLEMTFENTTIYANTARDGGAFRIRDNDTQLSLFNSTVVGNVGLVNGGAVNRFAGTGTILLENSIVAGNIDDPGIGGISPDIENNNTLLTYRNSVIGNLTGTTALDDQGGNIAPNTDLKLGVFTGNGGKTLTLRPLPGSPLIDAGTTSLLTTDQRGLPRAVGLVDIGAVEVGSSEPWAAATLANVTVSGGTTYTFQVTYADDTSIATGTLDGNDLLVTGPNGFSTLAAFVSVDNPAPGTPRTATYTFSAPGGTWNNDDTGLYTVSMQAGQVTDGTNAVPTGIVGQFSVARFFTVTNATDSGAGSLRQAILDANANVGPDAIDFDPAFFASPRTIIMTGAEMTVSESLTITGPGRNLFAILASAPNSTSQRIFNLAGAGLLNIRISDMALAGAHTTSNGGAVLTTDENVTFNNVVFFGNSSTTGGGAIASSGIARIVLESSVLHSNSAAGSTATGGAIRIAAGGNLALVDTLVSGNVSGGNGGAIYITGSGTAAGFSILNSTISGNTARSAEGGGLFFRNTVGMFGAEITNSTIANNFSGSNGGGLRFTNIVGTINIESSTVVGNQARFNGGGTDWATPGSPAPSMNVTSSIFANNTAPLSGPDIANGGSQILNFANSLLGDLTSANPIDFGGNVLGTLTPGLDVLAGNGGPTLTVMPLSGSPALESGLNIAGLTTDQRGESRVVGAIDMGSVEVNSNVPRARVSALPNVTTPGGTTYSFQVTYTDDVAIKGSTLDSGDVRVIGPFGFNVLATLTNVDVPGDGAVRVATYEFNPPGGAWDNLDFGLYGIYIEPNAVTDTSGTAVPEGLQGLFTVNMARSNAIVVNGTLDEATNTDGLISLREAVLQANATPGYDKITFDPVVFPSGSTITLTLGTELTINDSLDIVGPGMSALTIAQASGAASTTRRVFNIAGNQWIQVQISDLSITGGTATTAGGGVTITDENVTFKNVRVFGNTTNSTGGGGINIATTLGRLTLVDSIVENNSTTGTAADGGGIRGAAGTTVSITGSVITGNTSGDDGGGIYFAGSGTAGGLSIIGSSITNNRTTSLTSGNGAGIAVFSAINLIDGFLVRNSTISSNTAGFSGGGIFINSGFSGTANIQNSTIASNSATSTSANQGGGGILAAATTSPFVTINLDSTILSANANGNFPDMFSNGTVNYQYSAIGNLTGVALPTDLGNNLTIGAPLLLGPLVYNGGLTGMLTHVPGGLSPVRDAGNNAFGLTLDQRGQARLQGTAVDIGSVESLAGIPAASGVFTDVTTGGGTLYTLTIDFSDETGIKTSTFDNFDVRITNTSGFNVLATYKSTTPNSDAMMETATYEFTPPGGSWDGLDSGTYTISIEPNQVTDVTGNAVPAGTLGGFQVLIPRAFVVTTTAAAGAGSLRQALLDANSVGGTHDTITFDPTVFAGASTITLTGEVPITDTVSIIGPTAALSVTTNLAGRVFNISGPGTISVDISNMTLSKGSVAGSGGAILMDDESVTLTNVKLTGNTSSATGGGAIGMATAGGTLIINGSTLSGNSSAIGGGGAIRAVAGSTISITGSTVADNTSNGVGGGIAINPGVVVPAGSSLFVLNSTVSGNRSTNDGAGIYFAGVVSGGGFTIRNSTISNNTLTGGNGGGIRLRNMDGQLSLQNSTVANNSSSANGGGLDWFHPAGFAGALNARVFIESTVFANNLAAIPGGEDIRNDNNIDIQPVDLTNSYVETAGGYTANIIANSTIGLGAGTALLGLLGDNGGTTKTHSPLPLSPLLEAGSNPAGLTTDQRGLNRTIGLIDIGSLEVDPNIPAIAGNTLSNVTSPGGMLYTFSVTFTDNTAIKVSTLDGNDVRITGPNGFSVLAKFENVDDNTDGTPRTATYSFVPPGGEWGATGIGSYTVTLEPGQVTDTGSTAVPAGTIGIFTVNFPFAIVVDEVSDVVDNDLSKGKVSLREAIELSNKNAGNVDTITFDAGVFATPQTISLNSQLNISDPVEIIGAGATKVTLSPSVGQPIRLVNVDLATAGGAVNVSGLRFTGGNVTGLGGAIVNVDANLTLTEVVIEGNTASTDGGGIEVSSTAGAALTITKSIVRNNVSTGGQGGGVHSSGGAVITVTDSLVSGNSALGTTGKGGGIYFFSGGTLTMSGSTVSGNTATGTSSGGGGIYLFSTNATIVNSTIANNSATNNGGGIGSFGTGASTISISNSTIAGNSANVSGGGLFTSSAATFVNVFSTTIAQNTKTSGTGNDVSAPALNADFSNIGETAGITALSGFSPFNDQNPNLQPLADNGGFLLPDGTRIPTRVPGPGSFLRDNGADSLGLTTDQRGFARNDGNGVDIGAVEIVATPAKFTGIVINDGATQRSRVTKVQVNFDAAVSFVGAPGAAFTLTRQSDSATVALNGVVDMGGKSVTLTFTGGAVDGMAGNFSIADGRYTLTVLASGFAGDGFDGNGNGTASGSPADDFSLASAASPNPPTNIFRRFGDFTGNGVVEPDDFLAFRLSFLSDDDAFDFDGDGLVGASDFLAFRLRFLAPLP